MKGVVLFKKIFKQKQNAPASTVVTDTDKVEEWQPEVLQHLADFIAKVERIRAGESEHYPFPLNGSDLITTINGKERHAWYLGGDYHGPLFIYVLDDGTLVSRQDLYNTAVVPFEFQPEHKTLIDIATKKLRTYLQTEDELLRPLPANRHSAKLKRQLSNFRHQ